MATVNTPPERKEHIAEAQGHFPAPSRIRLPALDGLRGLAILSVMINHYGTLVFTGAADWQHKVALVAKRGYLGVDLFFVLSGFLITGILVDSRGSPYYLRQFYWRRSLRIFPLYFFYLALLFLVIRPLFPIHFHGVSPWWYVTYLANWRLAKDLMNPFLAHLWSLAVEEQFYIIWPLVVLLFPAARLTWACLAVVAGSLLFRAAAVGHLADIDIYAFTPARMDALAAGAFIAIAFRSEKLGPRVNAFKWPAALACAAVWLWTLDTRWEQSFGYSAAALFFAVIVFWAAAFCPPILTVPPLRVLGKYSYGLYMYHVFTRNTVYRYANQFFPGPLHKVVFPIATFAVTFLIAMISWRFLESPFLRLKDRYFNNPAPSS